MFPRLNVFYELQRFTNFSSYAILLGRKPSAKDVWQVWTAQGELKIHPPQWLTTYEPCDYDGQVIARKEGPTHRYIPV